MNAIEEENEPTESVTETSSPLDGAEDAHAAEPASAEAHTPEVAPDPAEVDRTTRKKLEEQLEALKRKEVELRRALVMADHPELVDAIRLLQGRTYALERVEAKLLVGLSKAELRRQETLQKKRDSLSDKRAELDKQMAELDSELHALGTERQLAFEAERKEALSELLLALGTHDPALHAAGIEATELVPEIARWLPEIEALAETLASHKTRAN